MATSESSDGPGTGTDTGDTGGAGELPRPLGEATLVSGPDPCEGPSDLDPESSCYEIEISCPDVEEDWRLNLRVGDPDNTDLGTVMFTTGGSGEAYWDRSAGDEATRVLFELREAGYRTVELAWIGPWWQGTSIDEGPAVLACRVATAMEWVHEALYDGGGFCSTGGSGGSAQVSYPLTHYGLDVRFDLVVPFEGPPFSRIDLGCLPAAGDPPDLAYGETGNRTARFDRSFGFPGGQGPCSLQDESFRERFEDASLAHAVRDFDHPTTHLRFLFGDDGNDNAVAQGNLYIERLMEVPTNDVAIDNAPGPHELQSDPGGANAIRDLILAECAPR